MESQLYYASFTVLTIFLGLIVMKYILKKKDLKIRKSEKEICKRDIQTGITAIVYIYRVPMIVVAIYEASSEISYYTSFVALLTVPVILLYIVLPRVRKCFLRGHHRMPNYAIVVCVIHAILISIFCFLTTEVKLRSYYTAEGIGIVQYCFAILSIPFICFRWEIKENGFQLLREQALTKVVIKKKVEDIPEPLEEDVNTFGLKELQCKICHQQYHSKIKKRTPRMLKQCGHTLCEGCADSILDRNNQDFINCPFCIAKTAVFGPAWFLPKNFAVIGMLEELKELEIKPRIV